MFGDNGYLEGYVNQDTPDIVLRSKPGNKKIVAICNAPDLGHNFDYVGLQAKTSMLSDNESDSFVMIGETSLDLKDPCDCPIAVERLVAKVQLLSLDVNFRSDVYKNLPFIVSAVYLINVPAEVPYMWDGISYARSWYNKMEHVVTDDNSLIYDDMTGVTISKDSPYSIVNTFYCYPSNLGEDTHDMTSWSVRHTRLVVEAVIGGNTYYYPVTLPKIERNNVYGVNLTVKGLGGSSPEEIVENHDVSFSFEIVDWEVVDSNNVTEAI